MSTSLSTPFATSAVSVTELRKTYRLPATWGMIVRGRLRGPEKTALDGVTLSVAPGEVLAVLGLNGAGKSTLLKCLAGLLWPDAGEAIVAGHDCRKGGSSLRRDAVYITGDPRSFAWRLTGRANLDFFASLHGYGGQVKRERVAAALARVGLDEAADRRVETYSTGMRQRLALARGFLGDPRVLLLDEPTTGLDPPTARDLRALVRTLAGAGRALLVATHLSDEVKAVADRAVILDRGRVTFDGEAGRAAEVVLG